MQRSVRKLNLYAAREVKRHALRRYLTGRTVPPQLINLVKRKMLRRIHIITSAPNALNKKRSAQQLRRERT